MEMRTMLGLVIGGLLVAAGASPPMTVSAVQVLDAGTTGTGVDDARWFRSADGTDYQVPDLRSAAGRKLLVVGEEVPAKVLDNGIGKQVSAEGVDTRREVGTLGLVEGEVDGLADADSPAGVIAEIGHGAPDGGALGIEDSGLGKDVDAYAAGAHGERLRMRRGVGKA